MLLRENKNMDIFQTVYSFLTDNTHNILSSIVGAIILYLLTFSIAIARNYWQSRKYKDYFVGTYYLYRYSTKIDGEMFCHKIEVYRWLGQIKIREDASEFSYTGSVKFTEGNIYLHTYLKDEKIQVAHIQDGLILLCVNRLWGIACLVSIIEEPIALRVLLSKEPLTDEMVREKFKSKKYGLRNSILLEKRDNHLFLDNLRENGK